MARRKIWWKAFLIPGLVLLLTQELRTENHNQQSKPQETRPPVAQPDFEVLWGEDLQPLRVFKGSQSGERYELFAQYFTVEITGDGWPYMWPYLMLWLRRGDKDVWITVKDLVRLSNTNHANPLLWWWHIEVDHKAGKGAIFCIRPAGFQFPATEVAGPVDWYRASVCAGDPDLPEMLEFWEFDPNKDARAALTIPIARVQRGKSGYGAALDFKLPSELNPGELVNVSVLKNKDKDFVKKRFPETPWVRPAPSGYYLVEPRNTIVEGKGTAEVPLLRLSDTWFIHWSHEHKRWEISLDHHKLIREGPNKWRAEKVQK